MVASNSANEGDQVLLYRDNNHLNLLGSVFVAERVVEALNLAGLTLEASGAERLPR
jgi:hypothetical protein